MRTIQWGEFFVFNDLSLLKSDHYKWRQGITFHEGFPTKTKVFVVYFNLSLFRKGKELLSQIDY